jgi:hypothetical protein
MRHASHLSSVLLLSTLSSSCGSSGGPTALPAPTATSPTAAPQASIEVTIEGKGAGTVTAAPSGPTYPQGSVVTLTATAGANSRFATWSGDCAKAGTSSTCALTLSATAHVSADFEPPAPKHAPPAIKDVYSDHYGDDGLVEINCRGACAVPLQLLNPLQYDGYRSPGSVVRFQVSSPEGAQTTWKVCDVSRASKPCVESAGNAIGTFQTFAVWAISSTKGSVDAGTGRSLVVNPGDRLQIIATDSFGGTATF